MSPRYSWTQPVCTQDYQRRYPGRNPVRLRDAMREQEVCCDCGRPTLSGIYLRVDPATVEHPTLTK